MRSGQKVCLLGWILAYYGVHDSTIVIETKTRFLGAVLPSLFTGKFVQSDQLQHLKLLHKFNCISYTHFLHEICAVCFNGSRADR
jgi:hypothetical protein